MRKCVFSGTFDPPTVGHVNVIKICLKAFDEVVVAVMVNPEKVPLFTADERLGFLKKLFCDEPRVKVRAFGGAAVDLLKDENTTFYVRGVRNTVDFEYENGNYFANKKLMNDIVTIYIPAEQESLHVSSSLVKNSVRFNKNYSEYVPDEIKEDIEKCLKNR